MLGLFSRVVVCINLSVFPRSFLPFKKIRNNYIINYSKTLLHDTFEMVGPKRGTAPTMQWGPSIKLIIGTQHWVDM